VRVKEGGELASPSTGLLVSPHHKTRVIVSYPAASTESLAELKRVGVATALATPSTGLLVRRGGDQKLPGSG